MLNRMQTMYRDPDGATKPIQYLDSLCDQIPVHIAFGEKADVMYVLHAFGVTTCLPEIDNRQTAARPGSVDWREEAEFRVRRED